MPTRLPATSLFPFDEPAGEPSVRKAAVPSEGLSDSAPWLSAPWLHAHCDGGARGNPGPAGYGALLTEADGTVVAELSEFLGLRTNNYAEYSGLLGCLQYALEHGRGRLKVVSDSELMVKQIQGKYQVKSPDLKPLFEEAKRRIAKLGGFQIEHALRHKNKDADRLANEAMDRGMKRGADHAMERRAVKVEGTTEHPVRGEASVPVDSSERSVRTLAAEMASGTMIRGFTRGGVVHLLGGVALPDGAFVKIIVE